MSIEPHNNRMVVIAAVAGSPTYKAGIRPGDVVAAVDGKATVRVTILRPDSSQALDSNLVRAELVE